MAKNENVTSATRISATPTQLFSRARAPMVAVFTCLTIVLAACGLETSQQYVQSDDGRLSFAAPHDFETVELPIVTPQWLVGLDASSSPSPLNLDGSGLDGPFVFAQVAPLDGQRSDTISLEALRTYALPDGRDPADPADDIHLVRHEPFIDGRGFEGHRIQFDLITDTGSTSTAQIAALSPDRTHVYQVRVSCSTDCFVANVRLIDELLDSVRLDLP